MNSLILFGIGKNCLISARYIYYCKYHSYQLHTCTIFYPISFSHDKVHKWRKLLGIIIAGSDVTDEVLIKFLHSAVSGEEMGVQ
jgi:hypothetical protein